jgi:hypothetical protein
MLEFQCAGFTQLKACASDSKKTGLIYTKSLCLATFLCTDQSEKNYFLQIEFGAKVI